jgi:two-component system sensor histidine kinase BaeS
MKHSLRYRFTASFLLITMITFLLIGIFLNVISEMQFKKYIIDTIEQKKEVIVESLESHYNSAGQTWDIAAVENLGVRSLSDGLIIRVMNPDGTVLWDAMNHNKGMCVEIIETMARNMESQYAGFNGGYTESDYQLTVNNSIAGTVAIGYYGPFYYTENDLAFLNTLNKLLLLITVVTGFLSVVLGTYTAKRMSGPISRVIKTAEQISEGNYNDRIDEVSNTKEIVELTDAINTLAEKLGNQESLRKRLTADVAHELRTPIANLQGHLEAMMDGIWAPDGERLKSCHEETVRLTKIVKDLESLARYENENLRLNIEKTDISDCMNKTLKSFEGEFRSKAIELKTEFTEQYADADQDKITQVFVNVISNALKYTSEDGCVEISVSGDDDTVRISVKDNGIGISKEDLPHIFERFYRADKSRSRITGGSGIGLAIVKSLVEAHGGSVSVFSEAGKGSEFVVTLPRNHQKRLY